MSHCFIDITNGHHLQMIQGPVNGRVLFEDLDDNRSRVSCSVYLETITSVPVVVHDCGV